MHLPSSCRIEPLEARIAPAAVLIGNVLKYVDTDGDEVTIKFTSKAVLESTNFTFDTPFFDSPGGQVLQKIDLSALDPKLDGTAITMTVKQVTGGDGFAHVGLIDATGHDLGKVTLKGDLGRILAGNADDKTGLAALSVYSLGAQGLATQAAGGSLSSYIKGPLGSLTVTDDLDKAAIFVQKATNGPANVGAVKIGGDLIGGTTTNSGLLAVYDGNIASVLIGGDLRGGTAQFAGYLYGGKAIGAVTILGEITGGDVSMAGGITSLGATAKIKVVGDVDGGWIKVGGKLGALEIGGDLKGKALAQTGYVAVDAGIGTIVIGGDFAGGSLASSGLIHIEGNAAKFSVGQDIVGGTLEVTGRLGGATVGRDLIGGAVQETGTINAGDAGAGAIKIGRNLTGGTALLTGGVFASGTLDSVTVGGTVSGDFDSSGYIMSFNLIKAVTITGDLKGGAGNRTGLVSADAGIGTVTIKGSVLGGGGESSGLLEAQSGSIGTISILHDLRGDAGEFSGNIYSAGPTKSLKIGGEFAGGTADNSGTIGVGGALGIFSVGTNMQGGGGENAGAIFADSFGTITIGADLIGGSGVTSGAIFAGHGDGSGTGSAAPAIKSMTVKGSIKNLTTAGSGAVYADGVITTLTVLSDVVGTAATPVIISATTTTGATATKNLSIGTVKINGSMTDAIIRVGNTSDLPERADGQIGTVTIGKDFVRSSILASVLDVDGDGFGDADDTQNTSAGDSDRIVSSIAKVVIKGLVIGTDGTADHFGIEAESIGSVTVGKTKVILTPKASNDFAKVINTDGNGAVLVNELAAPVNM